MHIQTCTLLEAAQPIQFVTSFSTSFSQGGKNRAEGPMTLVIPSTVVIFTQVQIPTNSITFKTLAYF